MVFQAPEAKLQMWPLFPRRRSSAALLPLYCSGRERGKKRQIKTIQAGMVLPSAP